MLAEHNCIDVAGASSTSTSPTAEATAAATTPAATTAATMAPTPEPTAVPTAVPTPEPTTEPTTAATTEPTAEPTTEPTAEPTAGPTATAVGESPPPPYLSATANYSVNTSAPAPPVPASAEVTPVPIVVPASTETASAVVSDVTTAMTPSSTAAAAPQASNPDGDNSLVPTPASCTLSVAALQQCGGRGGVCANQATNGTQCADAQWGNACCTSGYYCQRQQQWSWTCQRSEVPGADTTVSSGGTVADYKQCGGLGNCVESLCADAQWENYSCYDGFTCLRWDAFYWQCRDIPFAELS